MSTLLDLYKNPSLTTIPEVTAKTFDPTAPMPISSLGKAVNQSTVTPQNTGSVFTGSVEGGNSQIQANTENLQKTFRTPSGLEVDASGNPINPVIEQPKTPSKVNVQMEGIFEKYFPKAQTSNVSQYQSAEQNAGIVDKETELINKQASVRQAQNKLASVQAKLAGITAETQTQQLGLETQDVRRTGTVLDRMQGQISREQAIKALPLQAEALAAQAEIASAQGDATLAQDILTQAQTHLDKTFSLQQKDSENEYNRQKDLFDKAYDFASKEQQNQIDEKKVEASQKFTMQQNNLNNAQTIAATALANGQATLASKITQLDSTSPTFMNDLAKLQSQIIPKTTGTGVGNNNQITDNERALMSQFRGEKIVQDYNAVLTQKSTIDNYIQNGVGGPADLALVFSFMKGLDPTSVVRETEYANAAKSGNIFQGAFAKFNGYFKEKGGILPENVKKEFQNLVNQKLSAQEKLYNNVATQYVGIATRQGLNPSNVVIDYSAANTGNKQVQTPAGGSGETSSGIGYTIITDTPSIPSTTTTPPVTPTKPTTTYKSMLPDFSDYQGFSLGSFFK